MKIIVHLDLGFLRSRHQDGLDIWEIDWGNAYEGGKGRPGAGGGGAVLQSLMQV